MHTHTLPENTQRVLAKINQQKFIKQFYLAGGTALALHYGHRESIDLDFFTPEKFNTHDLRDTLSAIGSYEITNEEDGTLDGMLDDVKISFFHYDYPQLFPPANDNGTALADRRDIACMKIDAIASRGSKKDFIDLFVLLQEYSVEELVEFFIEKYKSLNFNKMHILKSLVYFNDAENDPMPKMHTQDSWDDIKKNIETAVKECTYL